MTLAKPDLIELLGSPAALASVLPPAVLGGPRQRPGGLVALSVRGRRALLAMGYADLDNDVPITESTVFDCGSLAKPFTAACVLALSAQDRLDLDEPVRQRLPELGECYERVRVRHLLSHVSGIRDYLPLLALAGARRHDFITPADVLGLLGRQQSLGFEPGTDYEYSNSNYVLLAVLAERLAGGSLFGLCADVFLRPVGLTSTSFRDDLASVVPGRAKSYEPSACGFRHAWTPSTVVGDGGLLSTAEDLLGWGEWLIGDIGAGVRAELVRRVVLPDGRMTPYGLGVFVGGQDDEAWFGHGGSYDGFQSEWRVLPTKGIVAVALSNWSSAQPATLVSALLENVAAADRTPRGSGAAGVGRPDWWAHTRSYLDQSGGAWQLCPAPPDGASLLSARYQVLLSARPDGSLTGVSDDGDVVCHGGPDGDLAVRFGARDLVLRHWQPVEDQLADHAGRFWCADLLTEAVVSVDGTRLRWRRRSVTEPLSRVVTDVFRAGATWLRFERMAGHVVAVWVDAPRARSLRFVRRDDT